MRKLIPYIILLIFTLPTYSFLFTPGYFNMHDDLQAMRILEMEKCFSDGQIPCRWAPDMAWGYGQAMFNFYSALPYYLGILIRILTPLSILATVKLLFAISLVASVLGMYLLAKEFWGKLGGFLSAVLYTYAPYHALDIYVRGALAESFALAILPFLWLLIYKIIKMPSFSNIVLGSISVAFLLMTHNISTMIYFPFTLSWVIFCLLKLKKLKNIFYLGLSGFLGLGLASFFLIPALFERSLIQSYYLTSDYSDFRAHFVSLHQLFFSRFWDDGPSVFGTNDEMSFQVGWPHWWLIFLLLPLALLWLRKKDRRLDAILTFMFLGLFLFSTFLTHSRSIFFWLNVPMIEFVQFPWRFLGLSIFFLSFAGGALGKIYRLVSIPLVGITTILAIILNVKYFVPLVYSFKVTDEEKLSGEAYKLQQKAAILDYLPKTAKIAPTSKAFDKPIIIKGSGNIENFQVSSNRFSFDANIYEESKVEIPVMYFPNWILIIDDKLIKPDIHGDYGLISTTLRKGSYLVRGRFINTPIRTLANTISVITFLGLITSLLIYAARNEE